ncbi:MAG: hypothetical protein HQM13_17270 [SAR324 cluster bacterium]|nr:hypothetical protein [SAR324 cluster bacterium]
MSRLFFYSLPILVWSIIAPFQVFSASPQIFSSTLASENYTESQQITAIIIIAHSSPITEVILNDKAEQTSTEETLVLTKHLVLQPGKNRILVEAKGQEGEKAKKLFLIYYGNQNELELWKSQNEEQDAAVFRKVNYMLDLRLQSDDNALFVPFNGSIFQNSQEKGPNREKKTDELLTDFNASYSPSTDWKLGESPIQPELSYRFQSQWNSTLKESGFLSHWFSGKIIWEQGNHRVEAKSSYITLRTNTAKASWENMAILKVAEISGHLFHSKQYQSNIFAIFIDQDFNDSLETMDGNVEKQSDLNFKEENKGHDLDGVKRLFGYRFSHLFLDSTQLNLTLLHTKSDTRKEFDDYNALGGILKLDHRLENTPWLFFVEKQYENQYYKAVHTGLPEDITSKKRADRYSRSKIGIQRSIGNNSQISANLIKAVNYSNLSTFDYQRIVANIGVTVQF